MSVQGKIKSPNGTDLLNPANESDINQANTDLFYIVDDEKVKFFKENLDFPKGIAIHKSADGQYFLDVFRNMDAGDGKITTNILEYQGYEADTIKVRVRKTDRSVYYDTLWISSKEIGLDQNHGVATLIKAPKK